MENKFYRIYWSKKFDWKNYARLYNNYVKKKNNYYTKSAKILIESSHIEETDLIIDLGCGTGVLTKELLKKFPKIRIIAIDISKEILKYYKNNFGKEIKSGQIRVIHGNAEEINKYLKEKVDIVFIPSSLWDMNLELLFKSLSKVIKPKTKIIANLPSLIINKKSGFIHYLENVFKEKAKIKKRYRRIPIYKLSYILKKNKLKIECRERYKFRLNKEDIKEFFKVLQYRYPFIFFSENIPYKKRYEKCREIFNEIIKSTPSSDLEENGYILTLKR